jgi:hypothetical protein
MSYHIQRSGWFARDVEEFGRYCSAYSATFAMRQFDRLDYAIRVLIGESPLRWSPFVHTGHPYHAYLFRVGERTQFWIVYTYDEDSQTVRLLRLWSTSRLETNFETDE